MKNAFKLLILIICFSFSINIIFAEEEENDTIPNTADKAQKQADAIGKYCDENASLDGCIYDKNNELYTVLAEQKDVFILPFTVEGRPYTGSFNRPKLKAKRSYQTFDGAGKAVYAACYRYDIDENDAVNPDRPSFVDGSLFYFTFITENKKGTCQRTAYVIPSDGTMAKTYVRKFPDVWNFKEDQSYEYNGKFDVEGYPVIEFNDWKAEYKGDCPKVFGYTANTEWYTASSNKYIFSDNPMKFNIDTYAFFSGEKYTSRPGCTVQDEEGEKKVDELLKAVKEDIDNFECPSQIDKMTELSNKLEDYYRSLRDDEKNPYRVLYGAALIEEITKGTAKKEIDQYIKDKMNSCSYKICNISTTEENKINSNLKNPCKNGCTLNNVNSQSTSADAKCYCCGGSQGCTYIWTEKPGTSCALQKDMKIGECIGTTKDVECRNCLVTAYRNAGLSESKIQCLVNNEILKQLTEKDLLDDNKDAADDDMKDEIEENKNLRENIYSNLIKVPEFDFYSGTTTTCAELLGPGLTKVLNFAIDVIRIVGVIASIVMGMIKLVPAVTKGDQSELNAAIKSCIWIAVVLVLIILFPLLVRVIGRLFGFDVSCIF